LEKFNDFIGTYVIIANNYLGKSLIKIKKGGAEENRGKEPSR
jgi:hypothetical protein